LRNYEPIKHKAYQKLKKIAKKNSAPRHLENEKRGDQSMMV
jgi:hypothetical protein